MVEHGTSKSHYVKRTTISLLNCCRLRQLTGPTVWRLLSPASRSTPVQQRPPPHSSFPLLVNLVLSAVSGRHRLCVLERGCGGAFFPIGVTWDTRTHKNVLPKPWKQYGRYRHIQPGEELPSVQGLSRAPQGVDSTLRPEWQ